MPLGQVLNKGVYALEKRVGLSPETLPSPNGTGATNLSAEELEVSLPMSDNTTRVTDVSRTGILILSFSFIIQLQINADECESDRSQP